MDLTKPQLIIVAVTSVVVIFFALIFTGILPGLQKASEKTEVVKATLNFWGINDNKSVYENAIAAFQVKYPGVKINYRKFESVSEYEYAIIDALASGMGPDIFMIQNTALGKYIGKIAPAPAYLTPNKVDSLFPKVVEKDFVSEDKVYALPVSIDTLVMFYNRDMFNQSAIVYPPKTWSELEEIIPKITKRETNGDFKQTAVAIGGSNATVDKGSDILELIMLQKEAWRKNGGFDDSKVSEALEFYTKFADSKNKAYTWNDSMPYSLDSFSQGKTAIIFNYASTLQRIRERNSFLDIGVEPMLKFDGVEKDVAYPRYWGYVVSKWSDSKNASLAWEFITSITTNMNIAEDYLITTGNPPALKSLIGKYLEDRNLEVFAKQALITESISKRDDSATSDTISSAIKLVLEGRQKPNETAKMIEGSY